MMKFIRILKEGCVTNKRGQVGHVYKVADEKRDEYRCSHESGEHCFYVHKSCCEEVEPGAASIPSWAGKWEEEFNVAEERKRTPVFTGVLRYFPDAIKELSRVSLAGNDQHHPNKPLHWDRSKSGDELDALARHLIDAGTLDTDGIRHSAKVAWRALANLQKEIEKKGQ
jgi:hypothetical protein